ncbi:MAG TPA: hypothetical protein PKY88_06530 [Anaerohalosphaeraceae bacterium]|nr:hypothetical protein [Anaerohalosphaeraceae bacterium]
MRNKTVLFVILAGTAALAVAFSGGALRMSSHGQAGCSADALTAATACCSACTCTDCSCTDCKCTSGCTCEKCECSPCTCGQNSCSCCGGCTKPNAA